ncbi:oxidoreductase isoform B [Micractinium conductrix]|nr:oxidoreductase isoform B [Micractinium conductrix]|eukprot:PSC74545.1 oxidoreductase isoform B [Micractinium conductrix]
MAAVAPPLKTAVVTGTASPAGIGRACARAFVRAGYQVLGVDKMRLQDSEPDEALVARYKHTMLDISRPEEAGFVPAACEKNFGSQTVHVLINNAGIADPHMPTQAEAAVQHWRVVIDTNLTGAFLMSLNVLPHMPAGQAAIVHVSATRAHQSEPHTEAYAAAKAGLLGLAHAQAVSLARKVRVNTVLPGWIDTSGDPSSLSAADHAWHPAGRVGRPEDVAQLCLFLADGERAGFITGQEFVVDGGVSKKMVYPEEGEGEAAVGGAAPAPPPPPTSDDERPPVVWPDA